MGKLAAYVAMKRDMAFDFEHELRSVRDLLQCVHRLSGKDYTLDLTSAEGYVAGTRARAVFISRLQAFLHECLVQYAHDLSRESVALGVHPSVVEDALGGAPAPLQGAEPNEGTGEAQARVA